MKKQSKIVKNESIIHSAILPHEHRDFAGDPCNLSSFIMPNDNRVSLDIR